MPAMDGERPIWQAVRAALIGSGPLAALLLIPAGLVPGGTWLWTRGLTFLAAYGVITAAGNLTLAVFRPAHFRVRRQSVIAARDKKQPPIDAVGTVALLIFLAGWVAFIPLDVFHFHLLPAPPAWLADLGGLAGVAGLALTPLAVWENRFATPNVQDQTDEGQRLIQTGVYRLVRHPIYLGNLLLVVGAALWLGSTAAVLATSVVLLATLGRIIVEEKDLRARLPGYDAYVRRVRGGLIPFMI